MNIEYGLYRFRAYFAAQYLHKHPQIAVVESPITQEESQRLARNSSKGFTLIELMIVIAIIGILTSVAVPQFNSYRKRGYNTSAMWDAKNAATAQEAYYVDYHAYANSRDLLEGYGLSSTQGVTLTIAGSNTEYTLVSYHQSGDRTYTLQGPGGALKNN